MHKPEEIEAILGRLMPPALSEGAQSEIEEMLDDLAGDTIAVPGGAASPRPWRWRMIASGIAAAGLAGIFVFPSAPTSSESPVAAAMADEILPAELTLVGESDRVESMVDEGWREDSDGSAMRSMRLNVIEENRFLDEETGIVMTLSQPREEILLMPISTF